MISQITFNIFLFSVHVNLLTPIHPPINFRGRLSEVHGLAIPVATILRVVQWARSGHVCPGKVCRRGSASACRFWSGCCPLESYD